MKTMSKAKQIKKYKVLLDKLWAENVRSIGICEAVNKGNMTCSSGLQAAHIFSRSHHGTRWDLRNGICMCAGHHLFWAHKEPYEFIKFCEELKGKEVMEELQVKAREVFKVTIEALISKKEEICR